MLKFSVDVCIFGIFLPTIFSGHYRAESIDTWCDTFQLHSLFRWPHTTWTGWSEPTHTCWLLLGKGKPMDKLGNLIPVKVLLFLSQLFWKRLDTITRTPGSVLVQFCQFNLSLWKIKYLKITNNFLAASLTIVDMTQCKTSVRKIYIQVCVLGYFLLCFFSLQYFCLLLSEFQGSLIMMHSLRTVVAHLHQPEQDLRILFPGFLEQFLLHSQWRCPERLCGCFKPKWNAYRFPLLQSLCIVFVCIQFDYQQVADAQ